MGLFENFDLSSVFSENFLTALLRAALYLVIGFVILRAVILVVKRVLKRRVSDQARMITTKAINYTGLAIIIIIVLLESGVNLAPILGAAGILGLAIGIASQAGLSNVISGLFLVSEKPFAAGDVVTVGKKTGIVMSIDLLSVKIRTFDNLYIRIPNEKIVSGEVTNITRFPIRRMDFNISVAYKENLQQVMDVLIEIARRNTLVLNEPAPIILFRDFADSGITLLFGVWFQKTDYIDVRNTITVEIKNRFDEEGIEIPFPHRTIYTGSATAPFPVVEVKENDVESDK